MTIRKAITLAAVVAAFGVASAVGAGPATGATANTSWTQQAHDDDTPWGPVPPGDDDPAEPGR